jgi:two-component system LytT family sensor kinase
MTGVAEAAPDRVTRPLPPTASPTAPLAPSASGGRSNSRDAFMPLPVIGRESREQSRKSLKARVKPALIMVAIWTAIGLFQALPESIGGFQLPIFLGKLIDAWAWALLTPVILLINARLVSFFQKLPNLAIAHLLLSVPVSLIHSVLTGLLEYPIAEIWWSPLRSTEFAIYFFLGGWMTYCALAALLLTFTFYDRFLGSQLNLERVEKRLLRTRLNALRLQLEPHFLFNALNTISSEITVSPSVAREMIENLGMLLRRSLDSQDINEIPLQSELNLLDCYIAIQRLRFGSRVRIDIDAGPATLAVPVPSMLLQPLIENAIRHGLEGRTSAGMVLVTAQVVGRRLEIRVVDDGVGLPPNWTMETCSGLGVRVTRERLEALYPEPDAFSFSLARRPAGGTEVLIRIPSRGSGLEAGED